MLKKSKEELKLKKSKEELKLKESKEELKLKELELKIEFINTLNQLDTSFLTGAMTSNTVNQYIRHFVIDVNYELKRLG